LRQDLWTRMRETHRLIRKRNEDKVNPQKRYLFARMNR
jgi:hypothetical protein